MPDFPHKVDTKRALRSRLLAHRRSRSGADRARAASAIQRTAADLVRHVRTRHPDSWVAGYVPVGSEPGGPDLPVILATLLSPTGLLLPVLRPDLDLNWAAWRDGEPLIAAGRGLREPTGPRHERAAIAAARLVFVPALAVDRQGRRLGRGGGSYDRVLARVPPTALTVALLYDDELLDSVPAEPHDQPVRGVITPTTGLVRLDEGGCDGALLALG